MRHLKSRPMFASDEHSGGGSALQKQTMGVKLADATEQQLRSLHQKHFADYTELVKRPVEFRKTLFNFIAEAKSAQIKPEDALNFHKTEIYQTVLETRQDCSGGQAPGVIIHANTSEDYSFSIFSEGIEKIDAGRRLVGGAFGGAINIRKEKHLAQTSDFISSAYMNGHMVDHDKPVPYELFICAYGKADEDSGKSSKDVIELAQLRREKFVKDWKNAGFQVQNTGKDETPFRVTFTNGELVKTYFPVVFHDLKECKYYVVENGNRLGFEEWVKKYAMDGNETVKFHLENLKRHEQEAGYFEELVKLTRLRKGIYCVDSRHKRNDASAIKDLGAIATEDQRQRILETPNIRNVTVCLHFNCGYLNTAIGVHEVGMEVKRMLDKGTAGGKGEEAEAARQFFKEGIGRVLNNSWQGFDLRVFLTQLHQLSGKPISKGSEEFLDELLKSQLSDTRNTAQHMFARGMLTWDEKLGTIVMPTAAELDSQLGQGSRLLPGNRSTEKAKAAEQKKAYSDQVTLIVAREQKDAWVKTANDSNKDVNVRVHVENFENGQIVGTTNGRDAYDAVTGKDI